MRRCPQCGAPSLDTHQYCPGCGGDLRSTRPAKDADAYLGMTIAGKFILRRLIGSGGMGMVYLSDQVGIGRTVAVKIMHRHLLGDETAAARFTNEARAASRLNHPNSISILDFGQTEIGLLYIVMEYLRGRSLDMVLDKEFPIPFGRVANVLCQAMEAVEAAHTLSIIHRDLKPENIFLEQSMGLDFVKVLDFGVAKMLDLEDRSITTPGLVPGTPEYMSPEQARGEPLDARSDVYSMGVILYELLTSMVPFKGPSALATMMSHVQDPPEPPSRRSPARNIPEALDSIVLWALAKRPEERISSAAQFKDILSAWAEVSELWPVEEKKRLTQTNVLLKYLPQDEVHRLTIAAQQEMLQTSSPALKIVTRSRSSHADVDAHPLPIFGRDHERQKLQAFLLSDRPGRTIRIQGTVGIGKTTLLTETRQKAIRGGYATIYCHSRAYGWAKGVLTMARRVASACLGLPERDYGPEDVLQAAGRLGLEAEEIPGLKELFGYDSHLTDLDSDSRRRERATSFRHLVYSAARRKPLLLLFEEIERFDDASRELILSLVTTPATSHSPFAVIMTHTPNFSQLWPPEVECINLQPLQKDGISELIRSLFDTEVDTALVQYVGKSSWGRPLFAEQAIFAEVHEGIATLPEKAADLIAARVERLPQEERDLLQWLSVIGDRVTPDTLAAIMNQDEPLPLTLLDRLTNKGYLRVSQRGYDFAHHLIAIVVYSSIPVEVRRTLHAKIAEYLRLHEAEVTTLAFHAFEANDGLLAVEELDRAGAWALHCLDYSSAVQFFRRALELIRLEWGKGRVSEVELDQLAVELARRLADVLRLNGDIPAARGVLEETLSVSAGEAASRAGLRLDLGRLDLGLGNLQRALRHLELAQADAESTRSDWLLGEVTRELSRALGLSGEHDRAGKTILDSLDHSSKASGMRGDPPWKTLLATAQVCMQIGYGDRARGYLLDALQQADRAGSSPGRLSVVTRMVDVHMHSNEWSEAEIRLTQAIDLAIQVGDRTSRVQLLTEFGRLRRIQGDVEQGRKSLERAVQLAQRVGYWAGLKKAEQEIEMLRYALPQALE